VGDKLNDVVIQDFFGGLARLRCNVRVNVESVIESALLFIIISLN
jgi:hypothetical protein